MPIIAVAGGEGGVGQRVERLARLSFRPGATITAADLAPVLETVAAHIAA